MGQQESRNIFFCDPGGQVRCIIFYSSQCNLVVPVGRSCCSTKHFCPGSQRLNFVLRSASEHAFEGGEMMAEMSKETLCSTIFELSDYQVQYMLSILPLIC